MATDDWPRLTATQAVPLLHQLSATMSGRHTLRDRCTQLADVLATTQGADTEFLLSAALDRLFPDHPQAVNRFRDFRYALNGEAERAGVPIRVQTDTQRTGDAGRRGWWAEGMPAGSAEVARVSTLASRTLETSPVTLDAVDQADHERTARQLGATTLWVHLEHGEEESEMAEAMETLLDQRTQTNLNLAAANLAVRYSTCNLVAGQTEAHRKRRRNQATIVIPLLTHAELKRLAEGPPWPATTCTAPVCIEPLTDHIRNGHLVGRLGSATNRPMVFRGGKPWPNRRDSLPRAADELADAVVALLLGGVRTARHGDETLESLSTGDMTEPCNPSKQHEHQGRLLARRLPTEQIFVHGDAARYDLTEGTSSSQQLATQRSDRSEAFDAVTNLRQWANDPDGAPYGVMLGDLGTGKTTTAMVLNNDLNDAWHDWTEEPQDEAPPLSIYLDLRTVEAGLRSAPRLNEVIDSVLRNAWQVADSERVNARVVLDHVRNQGALLIFDGLDEVLVHLSPAKGRDFLRELWRALPPAMIEDDGQHTGRLLMTCRTHYFPTIDRERSFFGGEDKEPVKNLYRAIYLLPFNDAQIRDYLQQHFTEIEREVDTPDSVRQAMELLSMVHNLMELAERPYNLRLISDQLPALRQARQEKRPVSLATLYNGFVTQWLERGENHHLIRSADKRLLMEDLAAHLWRRGGRGIDHAALDNWLFERLESLPEMQRFYGGDRAALELLAEDLRTSTFVVRPGVDRFEFAHTSLLEFFLARYLMRALVEGRHEAWAIPNPSPETLLFLVDLALGLGSDPDAARDVAALQATLDELARVPRPLASELAFRYCLAANDRQAPGRTLTGFNLTGASLRHLHVAGPTTGAMLNLSGCTFDQTDLRDTVFSRVRMDRVSMRSARLDRTEFLGCSLSTIDLQDASLPAALMRESRLNDMDLSSATTTRGKVVRCRITGCIWPDGTGETAGDILGADNIGATRPPAPNWPQPQRINPLARLLPGGHNGSVSGVAYSPDGTRIATAGIDGTVVVFDAATGEELTVCTGHNGWVSGVAYSPDGTRIATAGHDGTARVFDAATGEELTVCTGHNGSVSGVAYSPDGTRIATAGHDGTARVFDAATGEELTVCTGHNGSVSGVAYSPDGTRIATAGHDGTARVFDAATGEELTVCTGHNGSVSGVAYSPDGTRIATAGHDGTARVFDAATGEELTVCTGHNGSVSGVAYSPDGTRIATAGHDGTARVFDAATGEELTVCTGHNGSVSGVAYSPDGTRIATAGHDGTARVFDAATGEELTVCTGHNGSVSGVAYSPDGTRIATAGHDGTARVFDAATGEELTVCTGHNGSVSGVAYSPDGTRIATAGDDGTARVFDAATGEELTVCTGHNGWVGGVAYSPDGTRIATAGHDGTARVFDAATGEELTVCTGHNGSVSGVAYSPDGTRIATAGHDGTARVFDAATGEELTVCTGHNGSVSGVAYSPDGTRIATAGHDGTARVFDAATGEELTVCTGHNRSVSGVAYSPDGTRIATAGGDGTARVFDAATGEELTVCTGHNGWVGGVAYSPDGTRIATAGDDGTARVFDAATGTLTTPIVPLPVPERATVSARGDLLAATPGAWRYLSALVMAPDGPVRLPIEAVAPDAFGSHPFADTP